MTHLPALYYINVDLRFRTVVTLPVTDVVAYVVPRGLHGDLRFDPAFPDGCPAPLIWLVIYSLHGERYDGR